MLAGSRKFFVILSLITGCFHASNLMAVGLGDLEVNSTLSEPLDATIQLLGLEGLDESQILATLGTPADFDRANMERVGLIDDILMEVIVFDADQGLLLLTSDDPVEEPFLSMVISLRWPNGRLLRDYTALIDLPLFISDEPQAVPVDIPETPAPVQDEPEPVQPVQEVPVQQPRTLSTADTDEDAPEPTQVASNDEPAQVVEELAEEGIEDETVVIQSGDTLYDIAATNRPDTSVSVEQTMLAIQRNNPDAFIDNDINRIRVGQVLRIPSIQDIASINQTQALNQIALQNQASTTQPLALSDNDPAGAQQGPDELTILGGDEGTNTLSGDSDLAETIAALENQLAVSEENLDRARLENEELRARFTELEDQIEILQNIIAMQDERLAQLQANLAASPAEAEIEEPVAAQPQAVVNNAQTDDSLMGQLSSVFENTLVLVASLIGLILLVVGFLVWRRQAALAEIDEFDLGGAAVAPGAEAFETEEPDGASAGFLAALKSRFSHDEDEDNSDDTVDEYAEDDNEEGGLLAKLKGIFSRSSDADDDFYDDVEDDVYEEQDQEEGEVEPEESATEDLDGLDEQEDEDEEENEDAETALAFDDEEGDIEDEAVDDFEDESVAEESAEESDEEIVEELVEEIAEEIEDSEDDDLVEEALLDDSDTEIEIDVDEDVIAEVEVNDDAELSEIEEPEQDILEEEAEAEDSPPIDEPVEAAAEESGDILDISDDDLDLGDFGDDDSEDISIDEVDADVEGEVDVEIDEQEVDEVTETAEDTVEEETPESLDFNIEASDDMEVSEESASQGESEEAEDVETFDFALDDTAENTESSEETAEETEAEDVESFDFSLDESAPEPADEIEDEPQEEVESFDFSVDESPVAEEPAQEAAEAESDVEELEFDVSAVSSFDEESKNDVTEIAENDDVIELDEGEEIAVPGDEDISMGAQSSAEDPLAAALEEIDAEAEQETGSDDDSEDDGDLDFGNIDIDDSLFEEKESEETIEPITDRDESSTKLDLAVAYEAMGDLDGANEILNEVIEEGNEEQIAEAKKLLEKWEQS